MFIFWGIWPTCKCIFSLPKYCLFLFCAKLLYIQNLYVVKNNINQIVCHSLYNFICLMLSVSSKILQINSILVIIKAISYLSYSYINIQIHMRKKQREQLFFLDIAKICLLCRKILKVKLTNLLKNLKSITFCKFIRNVDYYNYLIS